MIKLFNRFVDTIFLKDETNLERDIKELLEIQKDLNSDELNKDIIKLKTGLKGENQVAYTLKNMAFGMYVLRDITIPYEDNYSQIDFVVITRGYIYLIECKNYNGDVNIDNNGQFSVNYTTNKVIASPYVQAKRHSDNIKKRLTKKENIFLFILDINYDGLIKPLVVLTNEKGRLYNSNAPEEVKTHVITINQLRDYIEKDLNKYDKEKLSSNKEMKQSAESFLRADEPIRSSLVTKYKLELKLRQFRSLKAKSKDISLDYVFTDEELKILINKKPKSVEELKNLNIFNEQKIKYHSKEIIDIINKESNY